VVDRKVNADVLGDILEVADTVDVAKVGAVAAAKNCMVAVYLLESVMRSTYL
jgi:hypothetical protein